MDRGRAWGETARALARWPLLLGAVASFLAAIALAPPVEDKALSIAVLTLGSVLTGAWLALYSAGDRDPRDTPIPDQNSESGGAIG